MCHRHKLEKGVCIARRFLAQLGLLALHLSRAMSMARLLLEGREGREEKTAFLADWPAEQIQE